MDTVQARQSEQINSKIKAHFNPCNTISHLIISEEMNYLVDATGNV